MVLLNLTIQLLLVYGSNKKMSLRKMIGELLITLSFLRPAVDAYRVCTNDKDDEHHRVDALGIMLMNKGTELATEAIPGCVIQIYVWLTNREQAGTYALVSIAISSCAQALPVP